MRFVGCTEAAQNLHKLHRTPVLCTTPPSPIPPFSPKVASKRATNPLPSHGLTAEYSSSLKPKETAQPIARTTSKWQLHLRQWQNPYRGGCGLPQGERSVPLRGSRGLAPGESLPTFFSEESRPGCGAERPLKGSAEGQRPSHRWSQGPPSLQNSPGRGAKKKQKPQKGGCKKGEFVR